MLTYPPPPWAQSLGRFTASVEECYLKVKNLFHTCGSAPLAYAFEVMLTKFVTIALHVEGNVL